MAQPKKHALDLVKTLNALDRGDKDYYTNLSPEERKAYAPVVLMRYMSSLGDQSKHQRYAIIATNDLVNIGFWTLSKHPELQHKLLCLAGLGGKQYRPWLAAKGKGSKSKLVDEFLLDFDPGMNHDELELLKGLHTRDSFKTLVMSAGRSDAESKSILDDWKKLEKDA